MKGGFHAHYWTIRGQAEAFGVVERAREGEKIGITRRGELAAVLVPAAPEASLKEFLMTSKGFENGQIGPRRKRGEN